MVAHLKIVDCVGELIEPQPILAIVSSVQSLFCSWEWDKLQLLYHGWRLRLRDGT